MVRCEICRHHSRAGHIHGCNKSPLVSVYGKLQEPFIKPCFYFDEIKAPKLPKTERLKAGKCSEICEKCAGGKCTVYLAISKPKSPAECAWFLRNMGEK